MPQEVLQESLWEENTIIYMELKQLKRNQPMSGKIINAYQARVLEAINNIGWTRNNIKIIIITDIIIKTNMLFTTYNPITYIFDLQNSSPIQVLPSLTLLNFQDQTRLDAFRVVWSQTDLQNSSQNVVLDIGRV